VILLLLGVWLLELEVVVPRVLEMEDEAQDTRLEPLLIDCYSLNLRHRLVSFCLVAGLAGKKVPCCLLNVVHLFRSNQQHSFLALSFLIDFGHVPRKVDHL
jgi:hypothetical protein